MVGIHGASVKVRLTAAPVDGKANQLLIKHLAAWFGVPAVRVSITQGNTSRRKTIRIQQPQKLPDFIKSP
jgi:uncharacterized protein (TIGR00251 family)